MRSLIFTVLLCLSIPPVPAQKSIRQVDFKNFAYPLKDHLLDHEELEWLTMQTGGTPKLRTIQLKNGKDLTKISSFQMDGHEYSQYEGFRLQDVKFADFTGNGKEDAIVVLEYLSGGTQTTNYVYVYAFDDGNPKLLAYCHTGDRAYSGLYRVYGEGGTLVFELLDPAKSSGDCCSSGIILTRYRWIDGRFQAVGASERRQLNDDRK